MQAIKGKLQWVPTQEELKFAYEYRLELTKEPNKYILHLNGKIKAILMKPNPSLPKGSPRIGFIWNPTV